MAGDEWVAAGTKQVCQALTLARTPADSDLHAHVGLQSSPRISEEVVHSCKVKHSDRSPIILQTDDSGFRGPARFSAVVLKLHRCRPLTPGLGLLPFLFMVWT